MSNHPVRELLCLISASRRIKKKDVSVLLNYNLHQVFQHKSKVFFFFLSRTKISCITDFLKIQKNENDLYWELEKIQFNPKY